MKRLLEDYIENVDTEDLVTKELKNSDDFVKMSIKDWYKIAYELGCSHILTVYVSQIQAMTTLRGWIKQTLRVLDVLGIEHTTPQLLGLYDHDLPIVEDLKNAPDLDFKDIKDDPVID